LSALTTCIDLNRIIYPFQKSASESRGV